MQVVIKIDKDIFQGIVDGEGDEPRNIVRSFQATIADAIKKGTPLSEKLHIPYLMHKEMDIPISECQKAYDVAIDYLRSQARVKG